MERFARTVIGYHGCEVSFAHDVLLGNMSFDQWKPSENIWDWLGHGIYFWEHSPHRELRWAREHFAKPAVLGGVLQLGKCFDLLDESITTLLSDGYNQLVTLMASLGKDLPKNTGIEGKMRKLDCLVINDCLDHLSQQGVQYDTVRGAFIEGEPAYPGAGFARETHIQVAVRNPACLLGVFLPNLTK